MNPTHLAGGSLPSSTGHSSRFRLIRTCFGLLATVALAAGSAEQLSAGTVVIYDQTSNPSGILGSQNFTDAPQYTCRAADDFVVPAGQSWTISSARMPGSYYGGIGPADSFNVTIFADDATFPGAVLYDFPALPYTTDAGATTFQIDFPSAIDLPAGTYWLAVQANMNLAGGTWTWVGSLTPVDSGCVWENPLDGFGLGATTFQRVTDVVPSNPPDLSFQLLGPDDCTDLAISQKATQKTVKGDLQLTYAVVVQNLGPATADVARVIDSLPPETTFVSASTSQGTITAPPVGMNGTVVCHLGSIPNGHNATIAITVKSNVKGNKSIRNTVSVDSSCETDPANNSSTLLTSLNGPNK
jgi:uncharacterized repeat protein (TIGR01451 family)